ncbi:MAG: hypothetical protein EOO11_19290 [Chitinophagaceae bacterium]|nr:MAG: hypothetical protein EOO11_19290 [Chitinophagaceae bacterium]
MPLPEYDQQLLTGYLDGTLDSRERAAVDGRLQEEPELRNELERLQLATRALRFAALQQQVNAARIAHEGESGTQTPVRRMPWLRYGLAAAAVFLLVWIGSRLMQPTANPEQLYATHFVEYNPGGLRGSATAAESAAASMTAAYNAQRFDRVVQLYAEAERLNGRARFTTDEMTFQCALAYMHLAQWPAALAQFKQLQKSRFAEDAEYYTALVFLRTGKYDEAKTILQKIHDNPAHLYQQQADADFIRAVGRLK